MTVVNIAYSGAFDPAVYVPTFDPTGTLAANLVSGEVHTIIANTGQNFNFIVPLFAPFFAYAGAFSVLYHPPSGPDRLLVEGVDYNLAFQFLGASRGTALPVYGGIVLLNNTLAGNLTLAYRTLGGNWTINRPALNAILTGFVQNPRTTTWEIVANLPTVFPPITHAWNLQDLVGASQIVTAINSIATAVTNKTNPASASLIAHIADLGNPHAVTAAQIGLGNVSNYLLATLAEAKLGTATDKYMTPSLVKASVGENSLQYGIAEPDVNTPLLPKFYLDTSKTPNRLWALDNAGVWQIQGGDGGTSIPESAAAFAPVNQLDVVRYNGLVLTQAIADGSSPDHAAIGFADKSSLKIVTAGLMSGFSGLTPGAQYFLSPFTPGAITTVDTNDSIKVGIARSSNQMVVNIDTSGGNMPTGGGTDKIFIINGQLINYDFTIKATDNVISGGPLTVQNGKTVTITPGGTWTII
jgi:hypothetical protein